MSERMNFKKYGFVRIPEEDFNDDGNRFTCYDYKGLRITYLKDGDMVFLSAYHPRGKYSQVSYFFSEVYDLYSKIESVLDEYNGERNMTNEKLEAWTKELDQTLKDCAEFDRLIEDLKANKSINIYTFGDIHLAKIYRKDTYSSAKVCKVEEISLNDWRLKNCPQLGFKLKECILDVKEEKELELILK